MGIYTEKYITSTIEKTIDELSDGKHFAFVAKADAWTGNTPEPDNIHYNEYEMRNNFIFGKDLDGMSMKPMIRRIDWSANTKYDFYDYTIDNSENDFFVINSSNNVYKCLHNHGDNSTIEPTSVADIPFELSDGYVWKYMYNVTNQDILNHTVTGYIPVTANNSVVNTAIEGAIHAIDVTESDNYWTVHDSGTFQSVNGNIVKIEDSAQASNGVYNGSSVYIVTGTGEGELQKISNYVANTSGKFITLPANTTGDNSSQYIITPTVDIIGDGTGAKAYSTILNDQIDKIVMVDIGSGYTDADVKLITSNTITPTVTLKALLPPVGGHGKDPVSELHSNKLSVYVRFDNADLPLEMDYHQVGIIKNIENVSNTDFYTANTFSQVYKYATTSDSFIVGEDIKGLTSNKTGKVFFSNTSYLFTNTLFTNGETVSGQTSGSLTTVINSDTPDINKLSGEIVYFNNINTVERSNTSVDTVQFVFNY